MKKVIVYVIRRDLGFAPNPFHGFCTLATCMAPARGSANVKDWVVGLSGGDDSGTGRSVYAMEVTETMSFDQYWNSPRFRIKRPYRNGSAVMMVGDNIYHKDGNGVWEQADSVHSNKDGSVNKQMLEKDTAIEKVLISDHFYYFGSKKVHVPLRWLNEIGFTYGIGQKHYPVENCDPLFKWLNTFQAELNRVQADPEMFDSHDKRFNDADGLH